MSAFVTALGARSPVGLSAEQTALGIRFSHLAPVRTKFETSYRESMGMSLLSALPEEMEGPERMRALAVPALRECLDKEVRAGGEVLSGRPVVLLGCPSPRPGFAAEDAGALLEAVVREAGIDADPERSAAFAVGHASFAVAMERALRVLSSVRAPVLVGCVDSYHQAEAAAFFDEESRILSVNTKDGFVPAEGAGFVAVRGGPARAGALAEVVMAGTDVESTVTEGKPNLARAATDLFARATQALGGGGGARAPGWFLRTTNREHHRTREDRFVATRFPELFDPGETALDELAEHLGDAGAASGGILAVYVCMGFAAGFAPHRTAVIALSSDGAERGIVALRAAGAAAAAAAG